MSKLNSRIPEGPIAEKWTNHKNHMKLVAPNNRPKIDVIVVGTGLAGASAAASLGEMGYNVKAFCFQDSPRRAHSIAAQGGINAAKNYQNDGDSVYRLFYDTIKGGDYRAREAMFIVWQRFLETSSTSVWLKEFLLPVNTEDYSITVHLVGHKFNVHFMQRDKQDNNYC